MPIVYHTQSTLESLPVGPISCRHIHRAPGRCSHTCPLHIAFVGTKSPKELFLQSYVEMVSRTGMGGWRQEYRDKHRNKRMPFYILRLRT